MKAKSKILVGAALLAMGSTAVYAATVSVGGSQVADTGTGNTATGGVVVTATVQPTLAMEISTGAIALGDLSTSGLTEDTLNIEVGTNAQNGVSVTASSGNGGLKSAIAGNHVIQQNATLAGELYNFSSALNTADGTVPGTQANLNTTSVTDSTPYVVYSNNKPEKLNNANADVTFKVGAKIDAETPAAADYTDTITFTVTGSY